MKAIAMCQDDHASLSNKQLKNVVLNYFKTLALYLSGD